MLRSMDGWAAREELEEDGGVKPFAVGENGSEKASGWWEGVD